MTLDDELNDDNMNIIEKIDNRLVRIHTKLARKFQDVTGKSKDRLETGLYTTSSSFYFFNALHTNTPLMLIGAFAMGFLSAYSVIKPSRDFPPIDSVYLRHARVVFYTLPVYNLLNGISRVSYNLITGSDENINEAASNITFGLGALSFATGIYLSSTDPGKPPKKRRKLSERLVEKFKSIMPSRAREYNPSG